MRLWDYRLIPVLDNKHLVALWRECIAIKRQWEKGTLKHRLVSYVMDYPRSCFFRYVEKVRDEMCDRHINFQNKYWEEIMKFCNDDNSKDYSIYPEHNDRYLLQCLYNLEEKATRGIISKDEWKKIYNKFKDFTELWDGE